MTEFEKMRSEEFYNFSSEECLASNLRAKKALEGRQKPDDFFG